MVIIMTAVMLLTLFSPFGVYYGVKFAKKKDFKSHRKIQNIIFTICMIGVILLEGLIRYSGGSGSLVAQSSYYGQSFFKNLLLVHIIGAVLTYILWIIMIIMSNRKFQKQLPGKFSSAHKTMGYIIFVGLIYIAVTGLAIYLMTLNLV